MNRVKNCIHIDMSQMSQYQQESLAAATLDLLNGILAQPGGRELLDRKKAELRQRRKMGDGHD